MMAEQADVQADEFSLGRRFLADPHEMLGRLREQCPVARTTTPAEGELWLLTRSADVRASFLDPRLSLQCWSAGDRPRRAIDRSLVSYDPPDHTVIRRLAAPSLSPRRVAVYRPMMEAVAERLLASVDSSGQPVDLMSAFASPFAYDVLGELFGIDRDYREVLYGWASSMFRPGGHRGAAADEIDAFMRREVRRRRAEPGDDIFSSIVNRWRPGGDVSEDALVSLCAMLLLAGFDSTAQMIGMCVVALLDHPDAFARLREDQSLVPRAVDELLRWNTPGAFGTIRLALEDMRVGGSIIPAGAAVLLSIAAANRDPRRFANPDRLDLERPDAANHITFGLGPHHCLGAAVARLELTVALTALLRHFPRMALATPAAKPPWHGNYQHRRLAHLFIT